MHPMIRLFASLAVAAALAPPALAADPDWAAVGHALGRSGKVMAGGVYRVGFPRSDLKVPRRCTATANPSAISAGC